MDITLRVERAFENGAEYKYELYRKQLQAPPSYAIRITMSYLGFVSEATTDFIFSELDTATHIFELLAENLATPSNLQYVLLDEQIVK